MIVPIRMIKIMREIKASEITETVSRMLKDANFLLTDDVLKAIKTAAQSEESPVAKGVLDQIIKNADIAAKEQIPLCQDCGTAVVFLEIGQDVHVTGGDLLSAVNEGVKQAYNEGYLRKSMVKQPFSSRVNTKDNTPAVIHAEVVPGDRLKVVVVPKGGGAENMSRLGMLTPAVGRQGVVDLVVKVVDEAGSNPCPPLIVGVGIGGTAEKAMLLAKKSLLREVGEHNPDPETAELEKELLQKINGLGIGPMGYGGRTTALAVNVEVFPSHIASMPVAVNLNCHSSRHKEAVL
jgi:fumarate hydratase subunit alpha